MPNPETFLLHARRLASRPRPSIILGSRTMSELSASRVRPSPIVDVHTHVYLPRYAAELRARSSAPRILTRTDADGKAEERLLILDGEPGSGRPVGPQVRSHIRFSENPFTPLEQYWDRTEKLEFMRRHQINVSFVRFCFLHPLAPLLH